MNGEALTRDELESVVRRRYLQSVLVRLALPAVVVICLLLIDRPERNLVDMLQRLVALPLQMIPPSLGDDPGYSVREWGYALVETLAMALVGTSLAFVVAVPLGFLGARNVVTQFLLRLSIRRSLDVVRGIDVLIWSLIFIQVIGLGPFCGILAIAISNVGELSKLFAEAIENTDEDPAEGLKASGASWFERQRWAVLPQVLPVLLSTGLYYFESNVRSSSILGFLGAGGIGYIIWDRLNARLWDQVGALLLILLVTVAIIDFFSAKIRSRLVNPPTAPLIHASGNEPAEATS